MAKPKEEAIIKVYDKFGKYMSMCKPKRASQLISRGNAIQIGENEIMLIILREDMKRIREYVYDRDNYTCQYCGDECSEANISLDHLHPRSRGGSDFPDNLVTSCTDCNELKKDMTVEEFYEAVAAYLIWIHLLFEHSPKRLLKQKKRQKYLKRMKRKKGR